MFFPALKQDKHAFVYHSQVQAFLARVSGPDHHRKLAEVASNLGGLKTLFSLGFMMQVLVGLVSEGGLVLFVALLFLL